MQADRSINKIKNNVKKISITPGDEIFLVDEEAVRKQ